MTFFFLNMAFRGSLSFSRKSSFFIASKETCYLPFDFLSNQIFI